MKTNLFYFSTTGNSLTVAKDIAAGLSETQIYSIPQVMDGKIDLEADAIGIVFPVYYCGTPRIVNEFIKQLNPEKIRYIFAVCTYGGIPVGALQVIKKQLASKRIRLNAGFSIQMPGNYLVKYGAYEAERQEGLLRGEKEKVRLIIDSIQKQENNKGEGSSFLINRIGEMIYRFKLKQFPTLDKNFTASEKCNGCEICEKVCPVGNIRIIDHKPKWQGNCEHCLACIQWCPNEAIQYSSLTIDRKRYHHPEVLLNEIMKQNP